MRAVHICVLTLGLALIVCSWVELRRVREYRTSVKETQRKVVERDQRRLRLLRQFNATVTEFPSAQADVSELDGVGGLERGWWVVSAIGAGVFVAGLVAILMSERLRRRPAANNVLEATAG
jgi:hypothetical protein